MLRALTIATAAGSALVAGVCFAFSAFVLRAIGSTGPHRAIATMQAVNRLAERPAFMLAFMGTALAAVALVGLALVRGEATPWLLAGCALYLVGMVGVTVAGNVPLNDTLAAVDPLAAGAAARWDDFAGPWGVLNAVRTVAAFAATVTLAVGLSAG
jgi:uncharacterized membrane protein